MIPFADFSPMHKEIREEMLAAFSEVYDTGWFIGGSHCKKFEKDYANFCGVKHCVGCGNGLDALHMILRALDIGSGDEVIVPAQTFIATGLAVSYSGAKPVLVDIEPKYYSLDPDKLEAVITPKTKAVLLVHLYGQIGRFDEIEEICKKHGLYIIEDAAQAHGAEYKGRRAGSLGCAAGFSFYPGKNLGALGDGGGVCTDDATLADRVHTLANYGAHQKYVHEQKGFNSRLDELQAALLEIKLKNLEKWLQERARIANRYIAEINNPKIKLPCVNPDGKHSWHLFPVLVEDREAFEAYLDEHGIAHQNHYPYAMHEHEAYEDLGYKEGDFPVAEYSAAHEVSLPLYYGMDDQDVWRIISAINQF